MTVINKLIQLLSLDFNNVTFAGEEEGYYYFNSEEGNVQVYEVFQGYTVELFNENRGAWIEAGMYMNDDIK